MNDISPCDSFAIETICGRLEFDIEYIFTAHLVDSSIVDGNTTSDEIWSFVSKTEPGALLRDIPIEMQYLLIKRNEYIS